MSHFRDLFHKPAERRYALPPPAAPLRAVLEQQTTEPEALPALSEIPTEEAYIEPVNRIVFHTDPRSPAADRFRFLRMRLRAFRSTGKLKSLLVTSPLSHEGKSTVILNLATALSERGKHTVLVVEADLHKPSLAGKLGLNTWGGLTNCLQGDLDPQSAIRRIEPLGWYLLPAGAPRTNPTELLQAPALGSTIQKLTSRFDWVLIDAPPVVSLTDALLLQQHADGSLLVVRAGRTPREAIDQTIKLLGQKHILGIVLNGVEQLDHAYYKSRYTDYT